MRSLVVLISFLYTSTSWTCPQVTSHELKLFFNQNSQWIEMATATSDQIEKRNPVHIEINFENGAKTKIYWGSHQIEGKNLSICWSKKGRELRIVHGFWRINLRKPHKELITGWFPLEGTLYFREK